MNKDVIYIDVEDDITAIIGKVKASKEKVVALVPPKRVGVLQSAVNLRLLARTATQADKKLALVTNNQSLIALAASASIPVAKNLQTKPELANAPVVKIEDDEDDIIEGASLPIGDHVKQSPKEAESAAKNDRYSAMTASLAEAPKGDATPKRPKTRGSKVPNFNTFRKRLVLIIIAAILLIGFAVWAIFFAPRATVVISAKTTSSSVNLPVSIVAGANTSDSDSVLAASVEEQQEEKTQEFTATGTKDAGSKATGTVEFSTSQFNGLGTIPAGTQLRNSTGLVFTTDSAVTLSYQGGSSASGTTTVTAAENGSKYNAAEGQMSGAPNSVNAVLVGPTSGGVTRMVKVVTEADVQKAKEVLVQGETDQIKEALREKFDADVVVLDESFAADYGDISTSPRVGEEGDTGSLKATVTYKLYGVARDEIGRLLDIYLKDEIAENDNQRVYENGRDDAVLQEVSATDDGARGTLIATAQIGPQIDDTQVREAAKGKRYGEIQQSLEDISGVESVDVRFFPFWISTVPDNDDRITVDFKLERQ